MYWNATTLDEWTELTLSEWIVEALSPSPPSPPSPPIQMCNFFNCNIGCVQSLFVNKAWLPAITVCDLKIEVNKWQNM